MKRSFCLMMAILVGVSCAGAPKTSHGVNVILMGEDKHREAIPRDHRVFRKVLDALSNELGDGGYRVLDETALTLDNFKQGRKNRTDAEIIDIARSIKRPPIDVVVIFEIYPDRERKAYTTKLDVEVIGRLLRLPSGERLGNFGTNLPVAENAPADCDQDCTRRYIGNSAKILAREVGGILTEKLSAMMQPRAPSITRDEPLQKIKNKTAFTLQFIGFKSAEVEQIEDTLKALKGYISLDMNQRIGQSMVEYEYTTRSSRSDLDRDLGKVMEFMGLRGRVTFGGGIFKVEKIGLRRD